MPTISVITPVASAAHQEYLSAAYSSLQAQKMPRGWDWEWLVQEDGSTSRPLNNLPTSDTRVRADTGRQGGPAMARTIALARAKGDLVRTLDADDLLAPGALDREITTLAQHPEIGWTACAAVDLLPDGSVVSVDTDPPSGPITPGTVFKSYEDGRLSILGTTACVRTDLVFALGGWPAVPSSEDAALVLALDQIAHGWFISEVGYFYRQHESQSTKKATHTDPQQVEVRRRLIAGRIEAMRRIEMRTEHAWGA